MHLLVCTECTIQPAALVLLPVYVCVRVCMRVYSTRQLPVRSAMSSHHIANRMTASQEKAAGLALGTSSLQIPHQLPALLPTGGCQRPPSLVTHSRGRRTPFPPSIQPGRQSWAMTWLPAADITAAGSGTAATLCHCRLVGDLISHFVVKPDAI